MGPPSMVGWLVFSIVFFLFVVRLTAITGVLEFPLLNRVITRLLSVVLWPISPLLEWLGFAARDEVVVTFRDPPPGLELPAGTFGCARCANHPALSRMDPQGEKDDELVCGLCGGLSLDEPRARAFLVDRLGFDTANLRELSEAFAGRALDCPRCKTRTKPLVLKGVSIDLCFGCGALWLDAGERERLDALLRAGFTS